VNLCEPVRTQTFLPSQQKYFGGRFAEDLLSLGILKHPPRLTKLKRSAASDGGAYAMRHASF
jgi:hypothetical protein